MNAEQLEELKEVIREANLSPVQRMCCLICDHCLVYRDSRPSYCKHHKYELLNIHDSVCFNFRPLRKE